MFHEGQITKLSKFQVNLECKYYNVDDNYD